MQMRETHTDVLRITAAIQIAIFELDAQRIPSAAAIAGIDLCLTELGKAVKALKKDAAE